jgi:hypothetical protein
LVAVIRLLFERSEIAGERMRAAQPIDLPISETAIMNILNIGFNLAVISKR